MAIFLYQLGLLGFKLAVWIAAWFNPKANAWMVGRRGWRARLAEGKNADKPAIWMHCASLGEFEQGRPVLEAMRNQYPQHRIVLSFFSPSGYNVRKNYPGADVVCYLPRDNARNARAFLDAVRPQLILFVKYDLWHFYIQEAHRRQIPMLLISAVFKPHFVFFKWYGGLFVTMLHRMQRIFVQTTADATLLEQKLQLKASIEVSGDTRYDRVLAIRAQNQRIPAIENWLRGRRALVAGSTWPADEQLLATVLPQLPEDVALILAPHEVDDAHLQAIMNRFPGADRFSQLCENDADSASNVLVIDNIGMLAVLYRYAAVAWVGGGFDAGGIHNILEPAVYDIPVLIGPNYKKFHEAVQLIQAKVCFSCSQAAEASAHLEELLGNRALEQQIREKLGQLTRAQAGASKRIIDHIQQAGYLNGS